MTEQLSNWAGNYEYRAARLHRPASVEEIQAIVAQARKVKALGSRHSFNDVADTTEDLISLENLNRVEALDRERLRVTVGSGIRYGELARFLEEEGLALHNLASLPHISVGGACATATHGSGDRNANLAAAVSAMEVVKADGSLVALSRERDGEEFSAAVVHLGALGVVTRLTLDLLPTFAMSQEVFEELSMDELADGFDAIVSSAYSVSLFTTWRQPGFNQVWVKRRAGDAAEAVRYGAAKAPEDRHPLPGYSAENCTPQMGVEGPWHERMPHFRMNFTPSSGEELQSEYLTPRPNAVAALRAVAEMRERIAPLLQVSEIRTIAPDDLWMSPCYRQACVGIHFTWKKDWENVRRLLPEIESALAPFGARPHWGKLFTTPGERLTSLYEKLPDFRSLARSYDPEGKFRNGFLDRTIFA